MIKKFEKLKKLTSETNQSRGGLSFSIVNTENFGKRIKLSTTLLKALGSPECVDIFVNEGKTGVYVVPSSNGTMLKKGGVLYSVGLVDSITQQLEIDFTNCTSRCFSNISVQEEDGDKFAEVIIKDNHVQIEDADL